MMQKRRQRVIVWLLIRGPETRRGRLGAYLWDVTAAWNERLLPRHRLAFVVARDALRAHR